MIRAVAESCAARTIFPKAPPAGAELPRDEPGCSSYNTGEPHPFPSETPFMRWHRLRPWSCFAAACLLALAAAPAARPQEPKKTDDPKAKPADVVPAKLAGFSDAGKFHLYKDEEILVRIDFTWKDDGHFDNKSVLEFGGQKLEMRTTITPAKDGSWSKIEGTSRLGKFSVERAGDQVK